MDGTAIEAIKDLAQAAAGNVVVLGEVSTIPLHNIPRPEKPDAPTTLGLHSLKGLADYVTSNRDALVADECIIHVASPTTVRVLSKLQDRGVRFTYAEATAVDLVADWMGRTRSLEDFVVGLQARFADGGDRAAILTVVGNVTKQAEVHVEDDGVSQSVTTRRGMKEQSPVPNPVTLAPYRTFREVEQVASPFVFRTQPGGELPTVSLTEADGGAWKLKAVEAVALWLADATTGFAIIT